MEAWPETVVPTQSLAESGITEIPANYVRPPSQRPSADDAQRRRPSPSRLINIPIIDLQGVTDVSAVPPATVRAVSEACREWGFFQLVNHGVDPSLMRRAAEVWKEFFHLPVEEKRRHSNTPSSVEGYGSRISHREGAGPLDWWDFFFLFLRPLHLKDHSKWPLLPPSCRDITEEYGEEVVKLCVVLMRLLSVSLGLDQGFLQDKLSGQDFTAAMRINYYPKCPQPDLTFGISPHTDVGLLTLLLADSEVPGLQVRHGDAWIDVLPIRDAFIINIADLMQVLTNGAYKSVEHRALVNAEAARMSLVLFFNPKGDFPVGPAEELVAEGQRSLYRPVTFNEHIMNLEKNGRRGKLNLEYVKIV